MKTLFGTDGIRGIVGHWPLTPAFVQRIGAVAGRVLIQHHGHRKKCVLMVRDTRASGPLLERALSKGLNGSGLCVWDGGILPTPALSRLVPHRRFVAGVVLSASHNPAEFNGIKFFGSQGTKLPDTLERQIEQQLESPEKEGSLLSSLTVRKDPSAPGEYLKFIRSTWPHRLLLDGYSIVLDCANGSNSFIAADLFRSLGARVHVLSNKPDGFNINRACGALHPQALSREVRRQKADIGIAFDGDGDRAIFVDEQGHVRDGDATLLMAARYLKEHGRLKKNTVVLTVMANLGLRRALGALGIRFEETPVGDKYVWRRLEETGAVLGGEQSGHVIFREHLPSGDGLLTAVQVTAILRAARSPMSALSSLMVRYPQILENVRVEKRVPLEDLPQFMAGVRRIEKELGLFGRVVVRYSGTEPLLRIMVEGPDWTTVQRHVDCLRRLSQRETAASVKDR
ncbi:MAG TPA: phosphoglucosamine mutase [Elusimicrobiota bacterium]|nr:phosphoglucosamine mutase [Elusimicrobiota bacterium]